MKAVLMLYRGAFELHQLQDTEGTRGHVLFPFVTPPGPSAHRGVHDKSPDGRGKTLFNVTSHRAATVKMLRDDDAFPVPLQLAAMTDEHEDHESTARELRQYANDDLDDVWGSTPNSPHEDDFSTITEARNGNRLGTGWEEQSDIPRMQEKHETEGYRDGVTKGKAENVQVGFDEGYNLGAVLGLKIGEVLGLLEGLWLAVRRAEVGRWDAERERVRGLYEGAKEELGTPSVFGKEYWGKDGIWTFVVPGETDGEVTFPDVAKAHPLVRKWEDTVEEEVKRWRLNLGILDEEHMELVEENEKHASAKKDVQGKGEAATEPIAGTQTIMGIRKSDLNW